MAKTEKRSFKEAKLIADIFEVHGGVIAVSKKLKISKQLVSVWKTKGFVPLSRVMEVAAVLQVPPLALNYKALSKLLGSTASWDVVKSECLQALRSI